MNAHVDYDLLEVPASKYYIYFLYFPGSPYPKYVGKGTGRRFKTYAFESCINELCNNMLKSKLKRLKDNNLKYKVYIAFETDDEEEALDVESFYIQFYGRRCNNSGVLYNIECFGVSNKSLLEEEKNQKSIYWRGFVFPSIGLATEVLRRSRTTFGRELESGFAIPVNSIDKGYVDPLQEESLKASANPARSKGITIDDVHYQTMTKAAKVFGYKRGSSLVHFLTNSKHNYQYEIHGNKSKYRTKPIRVEVDGITYDSLKDAADVLGFSNGSNLKRHLESANHKYEFKLNYE